MDRTLQLRIIAGTFGGRDIFSPKQSEPTRPTIERVREALFDIMARRLPGVRVLDLCAGTGALGLEALSRGAAHATFVDRDARNIELIKKNIAALGVEAKTAVLQATLPAAVRRIKGTFEVVFFDPPYQSNLAELVLAELPKCSFLLPGSAIVVERDRRSVPLEPKKLVIARRHRIGDSELWFLHPELKESKKRPRGDE